MGIRSGTIARVFVLDAFGAVQANVLPTRANFNLVLATKADKVLSADAVLKVVIISLVQLRNMSGNVGDNTDIFGTLTTYSKILTLQVALIQVVQVLPIVLSRAGGSWMICWSSVVIVIV